MDTESCKTLEAVFPDVLQRVAFAFGEPAFAGELPCPEDGLLGRIRFSGSSRGHMEIAAPAAFAGEFASNALGLEPGGALEPGQAEDAWRELLNIVCGNILTDRAGEAAVLDLTPPEVEPLTEASWRKLAAAGGTRAFLVDGQYSVLLYFHTESGS
jgi:CheY-specific phosphatase CheX